MTDLPPQPAPPLPERVGPWTVAERIGAGGMGVVFRASRDGRTAAVKVVRPGVLDDAATQARFAREVEVLRRVRDVHIAEFLDADLVNEPVWLATAFIAGPNLRDAVAARGALPEDSWWRLARGLAQALAVLEVHGITHRDIKPANVILAAHGPVLIDFGIANPEDAASLTGTGLVTGSPAWLSPEQAELKPVTAASDVFSLGSLLAFAGTGRPPFGQGAHIAVLLAIATKAPDLEGLSPSQRTLVEAMLAKQPGDRPNARQVLQWTKRVGDATTGQVDPLAPAAVAAAAAAAARAAAATTVMTPAGTDSSATTVLPGTEPAADAHATRVAAPMVIPTAAAAAAAKAVPPGAADAVSTGPIPASAAPQYVPEPPAPPQPGQGPRRGGRWWLWLVAAALVAVAAFLLLRPDGQSAAPGPTPEPSASPTVSPAPPAPAESQYSDGTWTLERFAINREGQGWSMSTTILNRGAQPASGTAVVYLYKDGVFSGTATGAVPETAPGGSSEVALTSTDAWQPGTPTVVFTMEP